MTTEAQTAAPDLSYSIEDFEAGIHRDSQYLYGAIEDTALTLATEVPGGRVLDVACGTGKQAMRIASRGCFSVGAEASMEMIGIGRWIQPESRARVVRSIAESLPFADATFDRVICQGSLDHFADPHAFMREAARVTKPDGRVVIALANFESISCRIGRAIDRAKRRLGRPRPAWRLYWETPADHNIHGDLPFVQRLGDDTLALERCFGMSLLWLAAGYGETLDRLPELAARLIWRTLDRIVRGRPQHADIIISIWRKPDGQRAGATPLADDRLTQDYDAHILFTFAQIPESPKIANLTARCKRWFIIAFAESWLAVWLFRAKVRLRRAGVPFLPGLCDVISRAVFGVQIGNQVEIGPGLMITHGNVVIDGRTKIGRNCQINPWVTIGLSNSKQLGFSVVGPRIGDGVHIGTGAKVLGPITVGDHVRIGANAVVIHDVPPNVTVVGIPARVAGRTAEPPAAGTERGDARFVAAMRSAIVDYKLKRRSLRALVDTLVKSFEAGTDELRGMQQALKDDLIFLDAVAATGGEESAQVLAAIDAIDAALAAPVG